MEEKEFKYVDKNDELVYFESKKKKWEKELLKYRESNEHKSNCAAYGDNCLCCLDKEWIWKFIERIIDNKT